MERIARVTVLDHGYLELVWNDRKQAHEYWGDDESVVEDARMSTGKGFLGWEPGVCPTCSGKAVVRTGRLCTDCEGRGTIPGDKNLIRRLWVKKHATPFEGAGFKVEVQAPIFVFREWHRHRTQSYNEMSARYTPLPDVNYVPSIERLMVDGGKNKQAGTVKGAAELTEHRAFQYRHELEQHYRHCETFYQRALQNGVPKELARVHLPVGRYSRMRASANLRNWLAFLTLRMAPEAQWEIRQYAEEVGKLVAQLFPRTWQLFSEGR
jgi:thymidylate synthase (FAD)